MKLVVLFGLMVYWIVGGEIVPPQDLDIMNMIDQTQFSDIKFESNNDLIQWIDKDIDQAFFDTSVLLGQSNLKTRKNFKVVFLSLIHI